MKVSVALPEGLSSGYSRRAISPMRLPNIANVSSRYGSGSQMLQVMTKISEKLCVVLNESTTFLYLQISSLMMKPSCFAQTPKRLWNLNLRMFFFGVIAVLDELDEHRVVAQVVARVREQLKRRVDEDHVVLEKLRADVEHLLRRRLCHDEVVELTLPRGKPVEGVEQPIENDERALSARDRSTASSQGSSSTALTYRHEMPCLAKADALSRRDTRHSEPSCIATSDEPT